MGDDKLCLAVLSDPSFRHLFEDDDWKAQNKIKSMTELNRFNQLFGEDGYCEWP